MAGGLRVLRARLNRGVVLWGVLSILFGAGAIHGLVTLLPAPKAEVTRASAASQHLTIDVATNIVSGLAKKTDPTAAAPTSATPAAPASPITTSAAPVDAPSAPAPASTEAATATPANAPSLATQPPVGATTPIAPGAESIVAPPAKEITERSHDFILPKRGDKDQSAATLYAKNFTPKPETKWVSLVLVDAGMNQQTLALILQMPHGVTVALSPYAPDVNATILTLHAAGFETWGMLPTMGTSYPQRDPGPLGLITSLPPEENTRRLHQVMMNTLGAAGLVLPLDETLSTHAKVFGSITDEITNRGLLILSTRPEVGMDTLTSKNKALLPSIQRAQVVLDANATNAEIQSKLDGLQTMLASRQSLIVIIPARAQLLSVVADWLNHNGLGPNVEIAPLSAQYKAAALEAAAAAAKEPEKKPEADKASETKPATEAKPADAPAAPAQTDTKKPEGK